VAAALPNTHGSNDDDDNDENDDDDDVDAVDENAPAAARK
jgi:hypothetical protein